MATFAERITELRLAANLKQTELADILKVSKYSVSGWERGVRKPEFETLDMICGFFNVTMSYLLGESEDDTPPGVPTESELASWSEADEIESLQYVARMLTCLSTKSYRIAASTIRSAYMADKADDTLVMGYDVKLERYRYGDEEEGQSGEATTGINLAMLPQADSDKDGVELSSERANTMTDAFVLERGDNITAYTDGTVVKRRVRGRSKKG